jgi:hypothetical protein
MTISLDKDSHVYSRDGRSYISVTTLIDLYVPPFDHDYWSTYKAVKDILENYWEWGSYKKKAGNWEGVVEYFQLNGAAPYNDQIEQRRKFYLDKWEKEGKTARDKGTRVHSMLERSTSEMQSLDQRDGLILIPQRSRDILEAQDFRGSGVFTELMVYNDEYRIAGTVDKVQKVERMVFITDYKTSKEITSDAFRDEKMLPPFETVPNANFYHYGFQLSLYGWMLERAGYKIGALNIEHRSRNSGRWIATYPVSYDRRAVRKMLTHYKDNYMNHA